MMRLVDASTYFDRTTAYDPDTGEALFLCQLDVYNDSKRDTNSTYRRTLSVRPGTVPPAGGAIQIFGHVWLMGTLESDGLEELYRDKYLLQSASAKAQRYSLPGFLSGTVEQESWSAALWASDGKELNTSSLLPQSYDILLPSVNIPVVHDVIVRDGEGFLVLSEHPASSGYSQSRALRLDYVAPVSATVTPRTFSPGDGKFVTGTPVVYACLPVRWQSLFVYKSQADYHFVDGDRVFVLPAGAAVDTSSQLSVEGVNWSVVATGTDSGAVVVHGRPTWAS